MNNENEAKERSRFRRYAPQLCLTLGLLTLGLVGCHDAHRDNPFDPELTPAVELLSVTLDSQQGTATLTWSQYSGNQPFQAYQVVRRTAGEITPDIRGTISDIAQTTFVDTMVEADRLYIYNVTLTNTSGFEVASGSKEVFFSFASPQLQVAFDSRTASALLSWNRAMSGFVRYEIHRQAERGEGTLIVHRTTAVDDTAFMDTGLDGNTEYRYTLVSRSTAGTELESAPIEGKFHALLREWPVPDQMIGGLAIDGEDRIYVSSTDPNQIYQFTSEGERLRQFPIDPSNSDRISLFLAADDHGVYTLVLDLRSGTGYVNALDPMGERRFRWPPTTSKNQLSGIAVSPDGDFWVAQLNPQKPTSTLYALDVTTGEPADTLEVQMPIINGMSIGNKVGVAVIPTGDEAGFGVFDMSTGEVLRKVGGPGSGKGEFNFSVASVFGADGRLFIVDGGNARIQVFRDGEYLTRWGQAGDVPGSFKFLGPSPFPLLEGLTLILAGIAVDSQGTIYVSDTFNNRLQVFEP